MQCPKCQQPMETVKFSAAEADRCIGCKGIWFDLLEHEDLSGNAAALDTGSTEQGSRFNALDVVPCPVCPNTKMIRMIDAQQPHIWFESCPVCFGRYYDAGEYRDLTTRSIGDFFKRFGLKARH